MSYSICGRKHSLSTCRWSCLLLRISWYYFRIGLITCQYETKPFGFLVCQFCFSRPFCMAVACRNYLYICHHMLSLMSVKPDKLRITRVELAISWVWTMHDFPFHSTASKYKRDSDSTTQILQHRHCRRGMNKIFFIIFSLLITPLTSIHTSLITSGM